MKTHKESIRILEEKLMIATTDLNSHISSCLGLPGTVDQIIMGRLTNLVNDLKRSINILNGCTTVREGIKPPLGLKPKSVHDFQRREEIEDAIMRYAQAGKDIPRDWINELSTYCK